MKAILLAAGKGTRLRPLTNNKPKVMVKIGERPVLEYNLNILKKAKLSEVFINLHYAPERIINYFGDGSKFGLRIKYSKEKEILGTAGAVKKLEDEFRETFFVVYGDNFTNCNLTKLLMVHKRNKGIATIAVYDRTRSKNSGIGTGRVAYDKKTLRINGFIEGGEITNFVNAGIYVLEPKILRYIPKNKFYDFAKDLFPLMMKKKITLYSYLMPKNEFVFGIDNLKCYRITQRFWRESKKRINNIKTL